MNKKISSQDWEKILQEQKSSGEKIQEFCKHRNLSTHAFNYQRFKLNKEQRIRIKRKNQEFIELESNHSLDKNLTTETKLIEFKMNIKIGGWLDCEIQLG